jgi:hypothetical protein
MEFCTKCEEPKEISDFYTAPSGKMVRPCKKCKVEWLKEYRKKNPTLTIKTEYSVSYTEMRHPDPAFMEANVQELIKKYADNEAMIEQAGLGFEPTAGVCDIILGE